MSAAEEEFCQTLPRLLVQSRLAFRRDLPQLLRDCPGQWVAYSGDRRVAGPDRSQAKLHQQCLALGLTADQFLVLAVEPLSAFFVIETDL